MNNLVTANQKTEKDKQNYRERNTSIIRKETIKPQGKKLKEEKKKKKRIETRTTSTKQVMVVSI